MPLKERIAIIGAGNVGTFLAISLKKAGYTVETIYSRTIESASLLAGKTGAKAVTRIEDVDPGTGIWIFALTDTATEQAIAKLGKKKGLLLHTSGSLPIDIFRGHSESYGVLYPLQTISSSGLPTSAGFPFCIEADSPDTLRNIRSLASKITRSVYEISSEDRIWLHIAAVFASNFSNHMYSVAGELLRRRTIPFEILEPLLAETARRASRIGPLASQTGPAVRNDATIIKKHLDLLSFSPQFKRVYEDLTGSIQRMSDKTKVEQSDRNISEMGYFKESLDKVEAFVFDVDGVFSDASLVLNSEGELLRTMNIRDGFAVQLAVKKGFRIGIITGGNSVAVKKRFSALGVKDVYLKSSEKIEDFNRFCSKYKLNPDRILYMGDDLPDLPVMEKVGFPSCPKDAAPEIKSVANYISAFNGGKGCVRDVIEQVMRAQGVWMDASSFIL